MQFGPIKILEFIDAFLHHDRQGWPLIKLYRSRTLIVACLLGSIGNPLIINLWNAAYSLQEQLIAHCALITIPFALVWYIKVSGRFSAAAWGYLLYSLSMITVSLIAIESSYALYWFWYPCLVIFGTLMLGLKRGFYLSVAVSALALATVYFNILQGPGLGRFESFPVLMQNYRVQLIFLPCILLMLIQSYALIHRLTQVRAIKQRTSSKTTSRLAGIGEQIGEISGELNQGLGLLRAQLLRLEGLAKRSESKTDETQTLAREFREQVRLLRDLSLKLQADAGSPDLAASERKPRDTAQTA